MRLCALGKEDWCHCRCQTHTEAIYEPPDDHLREMPRDGLKDSAYEIEQEAPRDGLLSTQLITHDKSGDRSDECTKLVYRVSPPSTRMPNGQMMISRAVTYQETASRYARNIGIQRLRELASEVIRYKNARKYALLAC